MINDNEKGILILREMKTVFHGIKKNLGTRFNSFNLTGPQGMLMGILNRYGEMKVSDLSEKLGLSNSTVSGIIDRLEKQDLVKRTRSESDRRVVYVSTTEKFNKAFEKNFKELENDFSRMMSKATPQEMDTILEGLHLLEKILNK